MVTNAVSWCVVQMELVVFARMTRVTATSFERLETEVELVNGFSKTLAWREMSVRHVEQGKSTTVLLVQRTRWSDRLQMSLVSHSTDFAAPKRSDIICG